MRSTALLVTVLTAGAHPACESVPLVAPTESSVRLVVAAASLPHGGAAALTATVTEAGGTPVHDGTVVSFSTTLGAIHPAEAPTVRGRATATFTAGHESGAADIVAYSGDAISEPVQVIIGAAAAAAVRLRAEPASLPSTGGACDLVATVLDAGQNPLPYVRVAFSTNAGSLGDHVVTTDEAGEARTTLSTTTAAEVTASVGEHSVSAAISIEPATTIAISFAPARPVAGQAVSFEVTVSNDARAIRSAVIDFGDGRTRELGAWASGSVTHAYAAAGAYTVSVTATDVAGFVATSSVGVRVDPAPAIPVALTVSPTDPVAGDAVTFSVEVSPPANAPAVRDVVLDFGDGATASLGALSGRSSVAHIYEDEGSYIATVTVRDAAGRRQSASIGVRVRAAPGIRITITPSPAQPIEQQPVTFTVEVSPAAGAPTVRRATIDFGDRSNEHSLGALTGRTSVAHVYEKDGSYIVTVTVLDAAGRRHRASIGIVVADG